MTGAPDVCQVYRRLKKCAILRMTSWLIKPPLTHTMFCIPSCRHHLWQHYNLRRRTHMLILPEHDTHLSDCNFLTRLLFKRCYWVLLFSSFFIISYYHYCIFCVLSSFSIKRTWPTYQVTITGDHVTHSDDCVVLITIGPGDEHVVIVSPPYRRDVMVTTTTTE